MALAAGDMVNVMTCAGDDGEGGCSSPSLSACLLAVSASLEMGGEKERGISVTADEDKSGPRDVAAAAVAVVVADLGVAMPGYVGCKWEGKELKTAEGIAWN